MKHKPIPKKLRKQVYAKYNGHCAYCGCELEYKDMQVDHAESLWSKAYPDGYKRLDDDPKLTQDDTLDNLMPACRQCNFYKDTCNIEEFRHILKVGIEYGMIEKHPLDGKFYFEKSAK